MAENHWSIRSLPAMEDEQFELWRALLEERTGMTLSDERRTFLETSLAMRMREIGLENYDTYYEQLVAGSPAFAAVEWSTLVDRLTVQETSFFRHRSSYALVESFLDEWLETAPEKASFDVWSVGCSTGEEPYSLAMLINEQFAAHHKKPYFGITATDISMPALSKAKAGKYSARKLELIDPLLRERYFEVLDPRTCRITDKLKAQVCFAQLNVVDLKKAPMRDMDLIYCQNMLIYFRRWRKREIVNRLAERLAPGGLMVLGLGEVVDWEHPDLERVNYPDTLAYRRRGL